MPVLIFSAGLGDSIVDMLDLGGVGEFQRGAERNVYIISNFIEFDATTGQCASFRVS